MTDLGPRPEPIPAEMVERFLAARDQFLAAIPSLGVAEFRDSYSALYVHLKEQGLEEDTDVWLSSATACVFDVFGGEHDIDGWWMTVDAWEALLPGYKERHGFAEVSQ